MRKVAVKTVENPPQVQPEGGARGCSLPETEAAGQDRWVEKKPGIAVKLSRQVFRAEL